MKRNASTRGQFGPDVVDGILSHVLECTSARRSPSLIGLSAVQGSGKSTLAAQLVVAASRRSVEAVALSLDDFYLGRRDRQALARRVHPLLAVRSVPGTHDIGLLEKTLDALAVAAPRQPARIPRFDKGRDTRVPPSRWQSLTRRPQLVVLEGWCVGVGAQRASALVEPINRLERVDDCQRRWRSFVNAELASAYERAWRRIDYLVLLQAPGYHVVRGWRDEQEQALRERAALRSMSPAQIGRFLEHAERLSRHALATMPDRADLIVELSAGREVLALRASTRRAAWHAQAARCRSAW